MYYNGTEGDTVNTSSTLSSNITWPVITDYERSFLLSDIQTLTGQPTVVGKNDTITSYYFIFYSIIFPVIATLGVVFNIASAVAFWCTAHIRSRGTPGSSMTSLLIGAGLVADSLFVICFVLTTLPGALVVNEYQMRAGNWSGTQGEVNELLVSVAGMIGISQ